MLATLVIVPFIFALLILLFGRSDKRAEYLSLAGATIHLVLTLLALDHMRSNLFSGSKLPPLAQVILLVTSLLYFAVTLHAVGWLPLARVIEGKGDQRRLMSSRLFLACLSTFLGAMTLTATAQDLGLLWVAVEATTLFSAPLICFHRTAESLEAMWKYLLICSVGIALALFGTMLLGHAHHVAPEGVAYHPVWYKAAFILALAGYGTKMGLAPFHTWLPDAHSEAPAIASALLSGTLLNCSFLALTRFALLAPEVNVQFINDLMLFFGALSVAVAALFIVHQTDYKRMLAYSSVENMGLILMLFALRNEGCSQAYLINLTGHSLIKVALFLIAGNILLAYGTRNISSIKGLLATHPYQAVLWLVGTLLITATPPSMLFIGEFELIRNLVSRPVTCIIVALSLLAVFCGMLYAVLNMIMGEAPKRNLSLPPLPRRLAIVPTTLLALTVFLSLILFLAVDRG